MTSGDDYRIKAEELNAQAEDEPRTMLRRTLHTLARSYLRLAKQADNDGRDDIDLDGATPQQG